MAIYLIVTEGEGKERVRLTHKPLFLGRSNKCHIPLEDSMVSGKHLVIKVNQDSRVVIKDLDTTNGTYLNGNKIQESFLYLEDFIQIGKIRIVLDDSEMNANELKLHKRDFERTNITFVRLGATVEGLDDLDEDEFGVSKQQTLLAKIRKKKENDEEAHTITTNEDRGEEKKDPELNDESHSDEDDPSILKEPLEIKKAEVKKKAKKTKPVKKEESDGLVGKLKNLFNK